MYEDFEQWRTMIEADGLVVSADGRVRFSATRREDLRILFGLAGIDIATIRTMEQYVRARDASRPYFGQWLSHVASRGRRTRERQLLIAIAEGDTQRAERLREGLIQERGADGGDATDDVG
jgi:hypothetical protein